MEPIRLTQLKNKEEGIIKEVLGGDEVVSRLNSLGVRPGKKVTKMSAHFWRGPITIMIDKMKIAIGHGMAQKIMVEVE